MTFDSNLEIKVQISLLKTRRLIWTDPFTKTIGLSEINPGETVLKPGVRDSNEHHYERS